MPLAPLEKRQGESPFDAVLAAASMAGEVRAPVRIAPNAAVPTPKPALPLRKRPAKNPPIDSGLASIGEADVNSHLGSHSSHSSHGSHSSIANISVISGGGTSSNAISTATTPLNSNLPSSSRNSTIPKANNGGGDKGLRHFSTRVCAKVEEKGATTYNEVADELVQEIGREIGKCDHKNIRRRVYDALNVLMAIDVIRKDKKEIRWLGLPNETATEMRQLEDNISSAERRIREKRKTMAELVQRLAALKNLISRNGSVEDPSVSTSSASATSMTNVISSTVSTTANSTTTTTQSSTAASPTDKLPLPFILINAPRDCRVHCEMLEDRSQYFFEFDSPFLINEDIELLRLMGLEQASETELQSWLPSDAIAFLLHNQRSVEGANPSNINTTGTGIDMGVLGLDEWDAAHVDCFLESMPPAVGGLVGLGLDMCDFTAPLTSPIKQSNRTSRPMRPFRQSGK
jgi:hypothetical protein